MIAYLHTLLLLTQLFLLNNSLGASKVAYDHTPESITTSGLLSQDTVCTGHGTRTDSALLATVDPDTFCSEDHTWSVVYHHASSHFSSSTSNPLGELRVRVCAVEEAVIEVKVRSVGA